MCSLGIELPGQNLSIAARPRKSKRLFYGGGICGDWSSLGKVGQSPPQCSANNSLDRVLGECKAKDSFSLSG